MGSAGAHACALSSHRYLSVVDHSVYLTSFVLYFPVSVCDNEAARGRKALREIIVTCTVRNWASIVRKRRLQSKSCVTCSFHVRCVIEAMRV